MFETLVEIFKAVGMFYLVAWCIVSTVFLVITAIQDTPKKLGDWLAFVGCLATAPISAPIMMWRDS